MSPPASTSTSTSTSARAALWAAGCLCLLLPAGSAPPGNLDYGKVGGEVSLTPHPTEAPITSILWFFGKVIAVEWDNNETVFHEFKGRAHLNTSTGVLTITGLLHNNTGAYTPAINHADQHPIELIVMSGVPVPTVTTSCEGDMTTCELTCEGDAVGPGPYNYKWMSDGKVEQELSQKKREIRKEDSVEIKEFSCQIMNPVSLESSRPLANPFTASEGLKIPPGLVVFAILVFAVLLLVGAHRLKAGEWFFQKGSMPWEADFWQKSPRDAAGSNSTTAAQRVATPDEETPMT